MDVLEAIIGILQLLEWKSVVILHQSDSNQGNLFNVTNKNMQKWSNYKMYIFQVFHTVLLVLFSPNVNISVFRPYKIQ